MSNGATGNEHYRRVSVRLSACLSACLSPCADTPGNWKFLVVVYAYSQCYRLHLRLTLFNVPLLSCADWLFFASNV
jgi:hypothetical protein